MNWKYLTFKTGALLSSFAFYFYPILGNVTGKTATLMGLLLGAPSVLVLLLPRRLLSLARGIALGQSGFFCATAIWILFIGLLERQPANILEVVFAMFVVQILFGLVALRAINPVMPTKSGDRLQLGCGTGAAVLFIMLTNYRLQTAADIRMNPESVFPVIRCAERYKATHAGEYPASLQDLAHAQGVNCIYPYSAEGSFHYGKIKYQVIHGADGRATRYFIILGSPTFWDGFRTEGYTDETGILHISRDQQTATSADPVPPNVTTYLHQWSQCLSKHAQAHPDVTFPPDLKSMQAPDWPCRPNWYVEDHLEPTQFYRVDYYSDVRQDTRPRAAFHLLSRPNQYGSSGIRHYYVDETGIIRGTPANREATPNDPPIPECEWTEHKPCPQN